MRLLENRRINGGYSIVPALIILYMDRKAKKIEVAVYMLCCCSCSFLLALFKKVSFCEKRLLLKLMTGKWDLPHKCID